MLTLAPDVDGVYYVFGKVLLVIHMSGEMEAQKGPNLAQSPNRKGGI